MGPGPAGETDWALLDTTDSANFRDLASLPYKVVYDPHVHRCSWFRAAVLLVAEVLGAGVLALPSGFATLGWVLGIASCLLFAATAIYAGFLLAAVRNYMVPKAVSYYDLARTLVGPRFGVCTRFFILSTWALLLPYYIIACANAAKESIFKNTNLCDYHVSLIVSALLLIPLQVRSLHKISYAATLSSFFSCCMIFTACASLMSQQASPTSAASAALSVQVSSGFNATPIWPDLSASPTEILDLYGGFSKIIFAYQGQSLFCEIMREMRDARQFTLSVTSANSLMMVVYLLVNIVANIARGRDVPGFLPAAMSDSWPRSLVCAFVAYITGCSYIITGQPLHRTILLSVAPQAARNGGFRCRVVWFFITSSMLLLSYLIANAIPFFADFQNLLGALTGAPIVFAWPALFFLRGCAMKRVRVQKKHEILCRLYLYIFFPIFTLLGVTNAAMAMIADWDTNPPPFSCRPHSGVNGN